MKRRSFFSTAGLIIAGAATGSSLLSGCAPSGGTTGAATGDGDLAALTFITPLQHLMSYVDVYVAADQGFFKEQGLRVDVVGGSGTASSVSQTLAGQGQVGKASALVSCPLIGDKAAEIITVAQGDARSQYSIASDPAKPLTKPADWQGKTIGVLSKGGATELALDAMSVAVGLDPTKVKKVVTGADVASLEFLKRGEVDGFITFLGSETAFKTMKIDLHYLNTDNFAKLPGDAYFVPKSVLDTGADQITGFLRACRKAFEFAAVEANTDAVLTAVGKYNATEVSDKALATAKLRAQVALCKPDTGNFLDINLKDWESGIALMRESGTLKDKARPLSDFVTTDIVSKV